MEKELKKCYYDLDLSYQATEEDVNARANALTKILKAKEMEKKVSCANEIALVKDSAKRIIKNIKKNGIPTEQSHRFESSTQSIIVLCIVLFFVSFICAFSFSLFL